jgi:pimeloyl-ACP methyl ester carboxylesterase
MHTELVAIRTETIPLDGAFYRPTNGTAAGAVLLFHGNTMNFYTGVSRFLPPALVQAGYACLAFNRRSHDILAIHNSRKAVGGACQLTREDIHDNWLAAQWMSDRGYPNPIIVGHSNGGTLAVKHAVDHPQTSKLVLLSAHAGRSQARNTGWLAQQSARAVLARAKDLAANGRGDELLQLPDFWYTGTANSILDRVGPELPDILELAPKVTCLALFLRGATEPSAIFPAEEFKARCAGPCDIEIVAEADHFYNGKEQAVTESIVNWLAKLPAKF